MRSFCNLLAWLLVAPAVFGQTDFIVSEANTLGGLYIDSDSLFVVSSADRAHSKSIDPEESGYSTYSLALTGPGFYSYRDICKVGNFLYVTKHGSPSNGSPGIYRKDLSDENSFFQLFIELNDAYGLASRSQELYVNGGNSIYKIDLTDPEPSLNLVNSGIFKYTFGLGTLAMKVFDKYLYVADGSGILRIDLDDLDYASDYVSSYDGWGLAVRDENTLYLTFSDDLNEFGAVYELKIDTQDYTKLATIDGFLQTYDIEYYDNSLFVTTLSGDNNKVVRLDLNNLSLDKVDLSQTFIYPNPAKNMISVSGLIEVQNYTIYNAAGIRVKQGSVYTNNVDVSGFSNGLYFLQFENGTTLKFIKE